MPLCNFFTVLIFLEKYIAAHRKSDPPAATGNVILDRTIYSNECICCCFVVIDGDFPPWSSIIINYTSLCNSNSRTACFFRQQCFIHYMLRYGSQTVPSLDRYKNGGSLLLLPNRTGTCSFRYHHMCSCNRHSLRWLSYPRWQ
jgi:hypothetical protein